MAKFMMIQLQAAPYAGTAYLNGAASAAGHRFVLCLSGDPGTLHTRIAQERPDCIGFSCMTGIHQDAARLAREIKQRHDIPIILGGPHPTLFPDVIHEDGVDMICRGEGEFALVELLDAIDEKRSPAGIRNLWVKQDGKVVQNELRKLADPLDDVPLIDWSCYRGTAVQQSPPICFPVRGCPYSCSYCFNDATKRLFRSGGSYVRHLSVERAIAEVRQALDVFTPSPVLFTSDTFGMNVEWMRAFLDRYEQVTELPFVLLLRPELAKKEVIEVIRSHRCHSVAIGVESGSERVRRQVLNRHYGNALLLEVAENLHRAGIPFRTYNMIGLPTETEDEMWETVEVNVRMKADFPRAAIFTPMPGTTLTQMAIREGYLDETFSFRDVPTTILSRSILRKVDGDLIKNGLFFFQTAVRFPRLRKLLRTLARKTRPNPLYLAWFYLVYVMLHRKSEGRSWRSYLRYVFANRKYR